MGKRRKLRVGSKLVENGKVYRVFKIQTKKEKGEVKRIIHYRPYYKNEINRSVRCSIPEENLEMANLRRPSTRDEVEEIFRTLRKKSRFPNPLETDEAKEAIKTNDVEITVKVFKQFWVEKYKDEESFTKSKRDLLDNALECFVEEIALAKGISLDSAKETILKAVSKT